MAVKNPQFEINIRKNTNANNPTAATAAEPLARVRT